MLSEYNIQHESVIHLVLRLGRGGLSRPITFKHNDRCVIIRAHSIGFLKYTISSRRLFGATRSTSSVFFSNGRALDDRHGKKFIDRLLCEYVGKDSWTSEEAPIVDVVRVRCSCKKCVPWRYSDGRVVNPEMEPEGHVRGDAEGREEEERTGRKRKR